MADREQLEVHQRAHNNKLGFQPQPDECSLALSVRPDKACGWTEAEYPASATRWMV